MSAATLKKAQQYLIDGRIKVVNYAHGLAVFSAKGSAGNTYSIALTPMGFVCSCPATTECAHVVAVKMICDAKPGATVRLGGTDKGLEEFLNKFPANRPDDGEMF